MLTLSLPDCSESTKISLLVPLSACSNMAMSNYVIEIPDSAAVVSDWDQLYAESAKYPLSMMVKYGGYVIEVDGQNVLATNDNMTKEVADKMASLPPREQDEDNIGTMVEMDSPPSNGGGRDLHERACSNPDASLARAV
jgi:hypothetical protein